MHKKQNIPICTSARFNVALKLRDMSLTDFANRHSCSASLIDKVRRGERRNSAIENDINAFIANVPEALETPQLQAA